MRFFIEKYKLVVFNDEVEYVTYLVLYKQEKRRNIDKLFIVNMFLKIKKKSDEIKI
jgi:hypothetical protein